MTTTNTTTTKPPAPPPVAPTRETPVATDHLTITLRDPNGNPKQETHQ